MPPIPLCFQSLLYEREPYLEITGESLLYLLDPSLFFATFFTAFFATFFATFFVAISPSLYREHLNDAIEFLLYINYILLNISHLVNKFSLFFSEKGVRDGKARSPQNFTESRRCRSFPVLALLLSHLPLVFIEGRKGVLREKTWYTVFNNA